ncbi:MAG: cytochrome c family protein [Nitrospinae bacterium]|nr:cytochrome c family protein [Nitrospinota bacterium]
MVGAIRLTKGTLFGVGFAPFLWLAAPPAYVGPAACLPCHRPQAESVGPHPHEGSFARLAKEGSGAIAACVICHVTGFGQPGGWLDPVATPELARVGCEACHGPGGAHAADPDATPLSPPTAETCRRCHTVEQDSRFDFDAMKRTIHPLPESPAP